ncbi:MAG: SpoIIE family protein phosphatase [Planctomycetes bacterium]|nr:SpoIIE family protein phosphatase [Planctomycetota bacterium]
MPLVLIADDDKAVRVQLKRMLEKSAHKVIEVSTAEEVLEQAKVQEPDLIIIDVNLPDKEALHLLEELRAESNLARTPVMVMAASNDQETLVKTFRWDVVDFILKPFDSDVLAAKIGAHTRLSQAYKHSRKLTKEMYMSRIERLEMAMRATDEDIGEAERHFRWMQPKPPKIDHYDIDVLYRPLGRLGGDLYDFVWLDRDRLGIVVGDVSGHGVQAAVIQVMARKLLSLALRQENGDLSKVVEFTNRELTNDLPPGSFVAGLVGVLDTRHHTWKHVRCGLPYPMLIARGRGETTVENIMSTGGPLGLSQNSDRMLTAGLYETALVPGEGLLLMSDGIIELNMDNGEQFDSEGVARAIKAAPPGEPLIPTICELSDVEHRAEDDVTLINISRVS